MQVHETGYDLSSPQFVQNAERILCELAQSDHRLVKAALHGKPVYIVTDMALAKRIFEDGKNFSFAPVGLPNAESLTEGARAFVDQGLASALLASDYDGYKDSRRLFNQALKISYSSRAEWVHAEAAHRLERLLDAVRTPEIDAIALCQRYWLPLMAGIIGLGSLPFADLQNLARCAKVLADGNGLHGDGSAVDLLAQANATITGYIHRVVETRAAPAHSALGSLLSEVDGGTAAAYLRTFVLGGFDTGNTALTFAAYLLAAHPGQRAAFLAMPGREQRLAMTELVSREAPAYHSPRFAVRNVEIDGIEMPAGTYVQLAMFGLNRCANAEFDIGRWSRPECPLGRNETLPFGHARHKCPGEELVRHLNALFLNTFFRRFPAAAVRSVKKECNAYSRGLSELILAI